MKKYTYICKTKEKLEKYEIVIVTEELEKLKKIIINQCGFIEKIDGDITVFPDVKDYIYIKNYTEEKIIDKFTFEETYKISYIKYDAPPLAILIDRLLKEDLTSLIELKNYDKKSKDAYIRVIMQQINILQEKVTFYMLNNKIKEAEEILEQIEKLKQKQKLNETQKNDIIYYDTVNKCIDYQLIDELSLKEYERVKNFFSRVPLNQIILNNKIKKKGEKK